MSLLRSLRRVLAPNYSERFTAFAILRESVHRPSAFFDRLNATNFRNFEALKRMSIDCNVCGERSGVYYDFPGVQNRREHGIGLLRETVTCRSCGSTMRHRTLAHGLLAVIDRLTGQAFPSLVSYRASEHSVTILDTDSYSPLQNVLKGKQGYISSKYLPGTAFGVELSPGVYNLDLQSISFESDRFDVLMTSDVMEHVENDARAHAEICRVLRPGGSYVFTVPCNLDMQRNRVLVQPTVTGNLYATTPHFHGDPISGGILAYRIYGRELVDSLRALGTEVDFLLIEDERSGIYAGDCFIATKRPEAAPSSAARVATEDQQGSRP